MGRRSKYAGERSLAGATAPATPSAGLEGWPPTHYCYACHNRRRGAEDIRADYCDQCRAFLDELERAYELSAAALPAAAKTVPEA